MLLLLWWCWCLRVVIFTFTVNYLLVVDPVNAAGPECGSIHRLMMLRMFSQPDRDKTEKAGLQHDGRDDGWRDLFCAKKVVVEELLVCLHLCGCCWLLAAGCWLLRSNFDMATTTHKLQVNKHTTMKIEVIVSSVNQLTSFNQHTIHPPTAILSPLLLLFLFST
jgi:hypothetical protein